MSLAFQSVTKTFPSQADAPPITALTDVSIDVSDGEFVAVVGPSGCGKSTLLNMAAGLYPPSSGEVFVSGKSVKGPSSHVGFMLQKDLLLPWRTIARNASFGLESRGVSRKDCRERAIKILDECHLTGFEDYYPYQLSGGMRQRAALARTLAIQPDVILLDEPFSALDAQTKVIIQRNFGQTIARENITTLLITHDLSEAVYMADRIVVLSGRPGQIVETIRVELPERSNPVARRKNPDAQPYIAHLFDLFKLEEAEQID
jgi:NitT/TauT family transport system ATP-binding protein